ncbi:3-methyladenine DNA glycosylase AlkD [Caulobacter ginsengisoli]|uniref:3-methyladenine DNA glycosylase AlkD n=1 Tax=Caulobacter ginsengisoli TaxID=400775 RepID=A0ABU0IPS1_9CAUL|nr:DNA alkylation repair protein [Caulobacter ginsengisoli]MDQ0463168.1 3-methyladenine DNA glycosylase AlkD [Caulobacter ginsengisoli]
MSVEAVMSDLRALATEATRRGMGRFGIVEPTALGVTMADLQKLAKRLGRDHSLAQALWDTDIYEARMLASLVDDPAQVTLAQMDRWRADFGSWAICDTVCFKLFDQAPDAWGRVAPWCGLNDEFGRRAGFALMASMALHGRPGDYIEGLALIERHATDDRNFVKKAVNWALRAIGGRRDPALKAAALESAERLAASSDKTARWVGKDALRQFTKPKRKIA